MPETHLPKKVRHITRSFVFRRFTWLERFKFALGYSMLVECHMMSEHRPGQTQLVTRFHLTETESDAQALIEVRKQAKEGAKHEQ